jgi:hypothetical protein
MAPMYYDREGKPITLWQWAALMEANGDHHVANDLIGEVRVSTVWLGLDHNWGPGPPLIFETMVFGGTMDEDQWRYPTEAVALAGHDQVVAMVKRAEEQLANAVEHTMIGIKYFLDAHQ